METKNYKRLAIVLGVALVLIALLLGMFVFDYVVLAVHVALANEQTQIFEQMRSQALEATPEKAVEYLEYAAYYYPSGTKQVAGSPLDRTVERARQFAIASIIANLRAKTGRDLGDDPKQWIDEFKTSRK